jgi:protein-L-isoaspartate(D-aspartate) O-methyltransferase
VLAAALVALAACSEESVGTTAATTASSTSTTTTAAPAETTTTITDVLTVLRLGMVEHQIARRGVADRLVLEAMRAVPRHRFVPADVRDHAYADTPLPIGYGQTISQPYIVALMSEALQVEAGDRVLEIGTGSGYQAAVLAEMGLEVYTIEIVPELAERAAGDLAAAGYGEVHTRNADGYWGWEEEAPFDAIIVTAAPDHVPQPLVGQLGPGGRLVIPVGPVGAVQTLWVFALDEEGELLGQNLGAGRFVPFTRAGQ